MKSLITLVTFIFYLSNISAQDSTQWNTTFDVEGSGLHLYSPFDSKDIRLNKKIFRKRRINNPFGHERFATDSPHFHFATYTGLKFKTSFRKKYHLQTNFFIEDRGASYGNIDLQNVVSFPKISFLINDTLKLNGHHFKINVRLGHLLEHQVDNGLRIYNVDDQAVDYQISYKNFFYRYNQIGDLSFAIGLDLEEYYNYSIGYQNNQFKIAISRSWSEMTFSNQEESYQTWNLFGNYFFKNKNELFFQIGNRYVNGYDFTKNVGLLLGANFHLIKNKTFEWNIFPKIRYYSANYNRGHYNPLVILRQPNRNLYSNTVGRYLYPLRNYYYKFDQWAVFTEYQNENVLGLGLKSTLDWNIFRKFYIKTNFESLSIRSDQAFYHHIFYEIDFCYSPIEGLEIGAKLTNKVFNLDAHYQTFYEMKNPVMGLHIRFKGFKQPPTLF